MPCTERSIGHGRLSSRGTFPQTCAIWASRLGSFKLRSWRTRSAVRSIRGSLVASTAASNSLAHGLRAASVFKASRRSAAPSDLYDLIKSSGVAGSS